MAYRLAMPEDASRRWMTYAEIAEALKLPSAKAGEAKARRSKWERMIGNDGFARVAVPLSVLEEPHPLRRPNAEARRRPHEGPVEAPTVAAVLAELRVSHEQVAGGLRRRAEVAEARAEAAEAQAREQRERAGRAEGERDAVQAEAAALRADVARLREEVLAERERANTGLIRVAEAARLREAVVAERERANAALERALEAEARLAAGTPPGARAVKALRAFLARRKRP